MKDEQVVLTFYKGKDNRTIARNQKGKICLLDINYCKENHIYILEDESWRCAIKDEKENCIIVQPITRTATAEDNYNNKLPLLNDKFIVKKKEVRATGLPLTGERPGHESEKTA
jgi:hypothetical protein